MKFTKTEARKRRHFRVRQKVVGTAERPRLNVFKSNTNFYAQIIDDTKGVTLVSASTLKMDLQSKSNTLAAEKVAEEIAKKALAANINQVVFDRNGYLYHGKIKAFAEKARENGLKF
ncbi:50S ribosomal protein L18 [Mycoplasma feriruminatoris]|uniref:Large ribosomal subunit protein uL18 n=2 Tax=Mycoplasma feriruminatoris TaxID=1179777 RepID=A0AAQ3HZT6_9MOLU|nr:50S ribosomal protein L18 [Mycoplasma feriruminatoris]UKS53892.1 ribosomal protein L18 [Mycoplasma feriruminatoris]WFQ89985.1 50S ribosomal protein L18 [Mycoplasma feriruminatoris]WFQ90804.1 50S ribosomal protein L18 [Mycoplasma feriruminatoris]WFQ91626.1 50S ribosomal protein L18 [Mycoplasma feriruminatoris]WFQ92452.1 50S ribosomal protein L18 [Mycoplasma feriruminatoris]